MNQDLPRWPRIAVAAAAVVGLGVGVAGTAVVVGVTDGDQKPGIDPAGITLVAYDTCDSALHELKAAALPHVGPFGLGGDSVTYGEDVAIADGKAAAAPREAAPGAADGAAEKEQSAAGAGEPAPPAGHSGTNTHESDVDEPDIVKTDGRRVVSVADGRLRVVDVATHRQTANVTLPGGYATQLLLAGDRALVLTGGGMVEPMPGEGDIAPGEPAPNGGGIAPGERAPDGNGIAPGEPAPDGSDSPGEPVPDAPSDSSPPIGKPTDPSIAPSYGTQLALVDLTGQGKVLGTLAVEGGYLDARQVGSVARVVVRSTPRLKFSYPDGVTSPADVEATNREVVESSSISDWLPRYELDAGGHRSSGQLVECTAVSHPKTTPRGPADRADLRPGARPRHRRPDQHRRRRRHRVRHRHQALRRRRPRHARRRDADREAGARRRPGAPRSTSSTSPRPAGRCTSPPVACRAACSTSTRCPSTRGTCASPRRSA